MPSSFGALLSLWLVQNVCLDVCALRDNVNKRAPCRANRQNSLIPLVCGTWRGDSASFAPCSAFADDTVLSQPAFKGSCLVRLHSDRATTIQMGALQDGFARVFTWKSWRRYRTRAALVSLKKNRSPLNVWHVARITAYLRCGVSGDIQHTLTSIRGKPIWE